MSSANGPPPARPQPSVGGLRFWLDLGTGTENNVVTTDELKRRMATERAEWDKALVFPEVGGSKWLPIYDAIPESKNWPPF